MATWEEILSADYNPVTSVRDSHRALMEKRQAENLARMQAANPGYQQGGYGTPANQQQFTQYGPPGLMEDRDAWLESQREVAGQAFGDYNKTGPDAGALSDSAASVGGDIGGGGELGTGKSDPLGHISNPANFSPEAAITPAMQGVLRALAAPIPLSFQTQEQKDLAETTRVNAWLDSNAAGFGFGFGEAQQQADNPESQFADMVGFGFNDEPGVGLPGFGGNDSASDFGGFGPGQQEADNPGSTGEGNSSGGTGTGQSGGNAGEGGGTGQGGTGNAGGPSGQY